MAVPTEVTEQRWKSVATLYAAGKSDDEIAAAVGMSKSDVVYARQKLGLMRSEHHGYKHEPQFSKPWRQEPDDRFLKAFAASGVALPRKEAREASTDRYGRAPLPPVNVSASSSLIGG